MKVRVEHPDFVTRTLKVESASWWRGPRLYQDGKRLAARRGLYLVTTDRGEVAAVRLRYNVIDPMPKLCLGNQTIHLVQPLRWYELLWIGLPLLLVLSFCALSAFAGLAVALRPLLGLGH